MAFKYKKSYTEEQIEMALAKLSNTEHELMEKRKEINKSLHKVRKDIEYYKSIDKRQVTMTFGEGHA